MATAEVMERLITAEEYYSMPEDGIPNELVRGTIVTMSLPTPRHGRFCFMIGRFVARFAEDENDIGRVVTNDSGVITERDPDTVRGPDVSYYSYQRIPKGPLPAGYLTISPDAAFEVRAPSDSWSKTEAKVHELLNAGVSAVCVLDPETESMRVYDKEGPAHKLSKGDTLTLPTILPGFELPIARLFE